MNLNKTICHLSFNHSPFDDRIYWKELLTLKEKGYHVIHIAADEEDSDFYSKEGIRVITVKRRKKHTNVWLNKLLQFFLKKNTTLDLIFQKAKSTQAQIYHYHDLQLNAITKRLKSLPQRPKVIYDAHEAYHLLMLEDQPSHFLQRLLYKFYIEFAKKWELYHASNCDYIIVTDEYTMQYFKKSLPSVPINIVFNYSYFIPQPANNQQKVYHLIYTGYVSKKRGIEEMIKSIHSIEKKIPSIKLLLIGTFESEHYKEFIMSLIQKLNINKNIVIKEPVPFSEVAQFYKQSLIGIGLFHKTPKYTTFIPIKLFEYMAFGLPVIFSNHGPSSEIIKDSNCGILVDPNHNDEICQAIELLLNDEDLYKNCSVNGITSIQTKYNWSNEKLKLLSIYHDLFKDNP